MSHHDKFWEKFGEKIRDYQPDGYSQADWAGMEELLSGTRPPAATGRKRKAFLLAAFLLAFLAITAIAVLLPSRLANSTSRPEAAADLENAAQTNTPAPTENAAGRDGKHGPARGNEKEENKVRTLNKPVVESPNSGVGEGPATAKATPQPDMPESSPAPLAKTQGAGLAPLPQLEISEPGALPEVLPPATAESKKGPASMEIETGKLPELRADQPAPAIGAIPLPRSLNSPPAGAIASASALKPARNWYGGILLGLNNTITDYRSLSYSATPLLGFFGGMEWNYKWGIQAELHAKYVNNYNLDYTVVSYWYNSSNLLEAREERYSTEAFLALEMPLVLKRRLSPRAALLAGLRPSLIFEAKNGFGFLSTQREEEADFGQGGQGPTTSGSDRPATGRNLAGSDLGLIVGMEWAFHPRWSLDARYIQGFRDLSPGHFYQDDATHLNSDLQLTIRRKF